MPLSKLVSLPIKNTRLLCPTHSPLYPQFLVYSRCFVEKNCWVNECCHITILGTFYQVHCFDLFSLWICWSVTSCGLNFCIVSVKSCAKRSCCVPWKAHESVLTLLAVRKCHTKAVFPKFNPLIQSQLIFSSSISLNFILFLCLTMFNPCQFLIILVSKQTKEGIGCV